MNEARTGKRLLLALTSQGTGDDDGNILSEEFNAHGILLAIGSILTLVIVIAMCACKNGKAEDKSYANGKNKDAADDNHVRSDMGQYAGSDSVENGGPMSNRSSANMSKHSRQASAASGNNIRPASTNLRELPEPPVDSHHHHHPHHTHQHHSRNASSSGITVLPPPPPPSGPTLANGIGGPLVNSSNEDAEKAGGTTAASGSLNLDDSQREGDPVTNEYDHFGPKVTETPPGYDQLCNVKKGRLADVDGGEDMTPIPNMGGGDGDAAMGNGDRRYHHYSQPKERTYDVVKDVKKDSLPLYHSDSFGQAKEEDPYNQIGESDNTVSNAIIKRIRQSADPDDLYATIQGDSDGSFAVLAAQQATMSKRSSGTKTNSIISSSGGISPSHPSFIPPTTSSTPSTPPGDEIGAQEEMEEEDEYATVLKHSALSTPKRNPQQQKTKDDEDGGSILPYNTYRPPEPPRNYGHYMETGDVSGLRNAIGVGSGVDDVDLYEEDDDLQSPGTKEHTYSKVSARESLASMNARCRLNNRYETLPDFPENTYATVEGGSGDGVIPGVAMRHRQDGMTSNENRLSQNSDTYAEIGISGGGLTTSVISNTSTSSTSNSNAPANSLTMLGTSSSSSGGVAGGAPIPPSLDSLHQMTKSQTSSEGDRLSDRMSDRYLASPDDWRIPGQLDGLGPSYDHNHHHHYHRADGSDEENSATLTRTAGGAEMSGSNTNDNSNSTNNRSSSARMVALGVGGVNNGRSGTVTDVESGEVTPIPVNNYEVVEEDRLGNGRFVLRGAGSQERDLDGEENDPNYESVDETRAKVALLKAGENSNFSPGSSPPSPMYATPHELRRNKTGNSPTMSSPPAPHVTVVNVFNKRKDSGGSKSPLLSTLEAVDIDRTQRKGRRPNHDYEEVDLSPPLSPMHSHPQQPHLSASAPNETVDPTLRERILSSHTYEELPSQVKLSKKDEKRKSDRSKNKISGASAPEEKKKSKEEKKKSKTEEKKKSVASAGSGESSSGSTSAGASWDGSKKSDSWETNRTRL